MTLELEQIPIDITASALLAFCHKWQVDELKVILGRDVDLVEKRALRNPYRRRAILAEHRVIYAT